jgi:hypothetical protein
MNMIKVTPNFNEKEESLLANMRYSSLTYNSIAKKYLEEAISHLDDRIVRWRIDRTGHSLEISNPCDDDIQILAILIEYAFGTDPILKRINKRQYYYLQGHNITGDLLLSETQKIIIADNKIIVVRSVWNKKGISYPKGELKNHICKFNHKEGQCESCKDKFNCYTE